MRNLQLVSVQLIIFSMYVTELYGTAKLYYLSVISFSLIQMPLVLTSVCVLSLSF